MAQRYIYLSDELNNKLKQEENASALITNLLNAYYGNILMDRQSPGELKAVLEEKEQEVKELVTIKAKEIEEVKAKIDDAEKKVEDEEKKKDADEARHQKRIVHLQGVFLRNLGRELNEEEMEEYLNLLDKGKTNIVEYEDKMRAKDSYALAK